MNPHESPGVNPSASLQEFIQFAVYLAAAKVLARVLLDFAGSPRRRRKARSMRPRHFDGQSRLSMSLYRRGCRLDRGLGAALTVSFSSTARRRLPPPPDGLRDDPHPGM